MKRYLPLFVILLLMILVYLLGVDHYLTYDNLKKNHEILRTYVLEHPFLSPFIFMSITSLAIALSLPFYFFLTIIAGFLFPELWSMLYVVIAATVGSTLLFLTLRLATNDILRKKAGPFLLKVERGFQKNAVIYLLFLHFSHLFPFWLINVAAALFVVPLSTFIWTTCVGILPSSYIFTQIGSGLGKILDTDERFSLNAFFNLKMKIALILLGLLPLIFLFTKKKKQ
jgi:uncharacterized membrane protein YdjX (TVP38/TMEM64 family)